MELSGVVTQKVLSRPTLSVGFLSNVRMSAIDRSKSILMGSRCHMKVMASAFSAINKSNDSDTCTTWAPQRNASMDKLKASLCSLAAFAVLTMNPLSGMNMEAHAIEIESQVPIADAAQVLPKGVIESKQEQLRSLERDTGYKVRVLSRYGPSDSPSIEEIRKGWQTDEKTIVVFVDPTSPNILVFNFGPEIQKILSRPFFTELQSRYGNLFYVRENGEARAVEEALDALDVCLRKGGCAVPPGLPYNQYIFTLGTSIVGGFICGATLRIKPQGFVRRSWVWALLFSPLWGTLSINFGLGPVVSRTDDPVPLIANISASIVAAVLVANYPDVADKVGLSVMSTDADE